MDDQTAGASLTPGAQLLVQNALSKRQPNQAHLGVHHWLLALVERHGPMAESLAVGVNASALRGYLHQKIQAGDLGPALSADDVTKQAAERATKRGLASAAERDVAAVILAAAGYTLTAPGPAASSAAAVHNTAPAGSGAQSVAAGAPSAAYRPRETRPTPTLEQFGRDLTREARDGKLTPVVGRQDEVQLVIETLCRRTKRNPVLVGPAGVGKTAIVEGLAQRVVRGEVPAPLVGARVLALLPSLLVAGAGVVGELQTRMKGILAEASQDGIILFIDEVHSVIGAGGRPGSDDVASLLKPALARGDLACIAATTDDEYRRFIEPDAALERRFQPVRVQELTPDQTLEVIQTHRDVLSRLRGVAVGDDVLRWLVDFAQQYLRNRYFPDKAVDLLEQCVANAVTGGKTSVDEATARTVAERMIGMPLALDDRLKRLRDRLTARALLGEDDIEMLVNRLQVTMRGMDVRPARPNAVVLLAGDAASHSEMLSHVVAEALFGAATREIVMDLSRCVHPADVTMLIGAPPGYVGYEDAVPLHRLAQAPWSVLRFERIDACHPQVREVVTQAISEGAITDGRGRKLYLSDTVVLMTAGVEVRTTHPIGFQPGDAARARPAHVDVAGGVGEALAAQVDLVCTVVLQTDATRRRWLEDSLLADLSERYRKHGVNLKWDESFVRWLLERHGASANQRDWERVMDESLGPLLMPYVPAATIAKPASLLITCENGAVCIERTREGGT